MTRWTWKKANDEDGHPYWIGTRSDGARGTVWLSGGDVGEYLTEAGTRHATLSEAKRAVKTWCES